VGKYEVSLVGGVDGANEDANESLVEREGWIVKDGLVVVGDDAMGLEVVGLNLLVLDVVGLDVVGLAEGSEDGNSVARCDGVIVLVDRSVGDCVVKGEGSSERVGLVDVTTDEGWIDWDGIFEGTGESDVFSHSRQSL